MERDTRSVQVLTTDQLTALGQGRREDLPEGGVVCRVDFWQGDKAGPKLEDKTAHVWAPLKYAARQWGEAQALEIKETIGGHRAIISEATDVTATIGSTAVTTSAASA